MPVGTYLATLSAKTYNYALTIGGQPVQDRIPLNGEGANSLSWSLSGENQVGQMSFTIEDYDTTFSLAFGGEVELVDWRGGTRTVLWGGVLVEAVITERGSNYGRMINCTALSYDAWLDWKMIPRWVSKQDIPATGTRSGEKRSFTNDQDVVMTLVERFGGDQVPVIVKKEFVQSTNTNMPSIELVGVTMRDALQQIADTATTASDTPNRFFYVDENRKLHWYKDSEKLVAPYYITDDIYTRRVLGTAGLVSHWIFSDKTGTTATDAKGYANGTYTGGVSLNVTSGVINEPYLTAASFDGTSAYVTASGASLHPGDTFTIELWFKRNGLGTAQALYSAGTNDVEVGFDASNKLVVNKEGVGANFTSTAAYTDTDWHHLVVRRSPGATTVHMDGSSIAGTTVAQTFAAAAGAINIGRRLSAADRYFNGSIGSVAVYSTNIGSSESMRHATIGDGVNPIGLQVSLSAYDGRERVYIAGKNAKATGWVSVREWTRDATFGRATYGRADRVALRDAFLDRPDVESASQKNSIGTAWLRRHDDPRQTASFQVEGYNGWKPGQLVYIYNKNLDCITKDADGFQADDGRGVPFEITDVQADASLGNGVIRYSITCGPRFLRGSRILFRNQRVS